MSKDLRLILKPNFNSLEPKDINQAIRELEEKTRYLRLDIKLPVGFMETIVKLNETRERLTRHIEREFPNLTKIAPKLSAQLIMGPLLFADSTLNFDFHKMLIKLLDEHITKYGMADLPSSSMETPLPTDVEEILTDNKVANDKYWEVVFRWIEVIMIIYTLISNHQSNEQMDRIEDKLDKLLKQRPPIEQFYEQGPIQKPTQHKLADQQNDVEEV